LNCSPVSARLLAVGYDEAPLIPRSDLMLDYEEFTLR